jgi:hypothetical protein
MNSIMIVCMKLISFYISRKFIAKLIGWNLSTKKYIVIYLSFRHAINLRMDFFYQRS